MARQGLGEQVEVTPNDCSDLCEYEDCVVNVKPDGVWYGRFTVEDAPRLVREHLVDGQRLENRLIDREKRTVGGVPVPPLV